MFIYVSHLQNCLLYSRSCKHIFVHLCEFGGPVFTVMFVEPLQDMEWSDLQFKFRFCGDNEQACLQIKHHTGEKVCIYMLYIFNMLYIYMKYILCILYRDKDLSPVKARNYKPSTTNVPDCVKCPLSVKCLIQVRGSINLGLLKNSNIHKSAN